MAIYVGMTRRLWDPLPGGGWIDNKKIASFNKMLTNPFHMNNLDVTFTLSRAIETNRLCVITEKDAYLIEDILMYGFPDERESLKRELRNLNIEQLL